MHPAYHYRYRRYRPRTRFGPGISLILLLALALLLINCLVILSPAFTRAGHAVLNTLLAWNDRDPKSIMRVAVPVMAWSGSREDVPQVVAPGALVAQLGRVFRPDPRRPVHIVAYQMPLWAREVNGQEPSAPVMAPEMSLDHEPLPGEEAIQSPPPLSEESLVAIYNTHTGETYALTDGMERLTGKRGGVVKAAEALEDELEKKYGVRVARSDTINDTNYNSSYTKSQETLQKLLEENPSVQVVLDIHRDAGKSRENSLVTVDGQQVAPVLIVVGSDARSPFPTWRQNYNFAQELAAEIDKQRPGLCLGVRILEGRYNQFLHPRAVLLEVGSVSNSTEEAVLAARMLAGPVAELVKRYMDGE
ncbi:stage II sporulation protein P [Desulfallas thermosapovorans]|uniref:Stage II sporulation protein P n=1 Tax=Desulfallas thermosapovorans DSM 6562 TaxID=1121431 RepID=A0A5S4ZW38_9FIRM|nr:stage II sporulation protein P [Desulfallas thermosapovorans]TYO97238.1 stage II sporulation protein P [Desulfallas thermosapovorans DSM 6562]